MSNLSDRLSPGARRAEPAAKGSGLRALAFLGLSVVAALGAGLLFNRYLARQGEGAGVATVKVVVAAVDLPVATPLRAEQLAVIDWPRASVPQGAPGEVSALVGKVSLVPIAKGEPLLPAKLATGDVRQGLSAILPPSMRAAAVKVDDVVGVAGFIHPGDHVDVIVTMKPREDTGAPYTSKVILQNVPVLAVGKELDRKAKELDKAVPVTVATLMVDAAGSERLALAASKGQLLLTLRGGADAEEIQTPGVIPPVLLGGAAQLALAAPKPEAPAPTPAAASAGPRPAPARRPTALAAKAEPVAAPAAPTEVEILRGDRFEKRQFKGGEGSP